MKKTISILLAVVLLFSALPVFASAQSAATVDIKGMSVIAEAGVTVYAPVMVNAQNITTLAVEVTYDKTVFELVGVEKALRNFVVKKKEKDNKNFKKSSKKNEKTLKNNKKSRLKISLYFFLGIRKAAANSFACNSISELPFR